jgi:hypothetical protein
MRDPNSPVIAQAVIAPLRRIAETTGESKHLGMLAAALRSIDPGEAETLLRRIYYQRRPPPRLPYCRSPD